jgi:glycosyltransferase involved in cell wall biosynthesis
MTICFDLRAIQIGHEKRGIGMYIRSVLENLPLDDSTYIFYTFDKNDPVKDLDIDVKFDYIRVTTPTIKTTLNKPTDIFGLLRLVNHSFGPLKKYRPDVFVQFDFTLGIPRWRKTKTITIGYDLIPLIRKNEYLPSISFAWQHSLGKKAKLRAAVRSVYYRLKYRLHYRVFKKADGIIAISQAAAQSFIKILGINAAKVRAIPLAPVFDAAPEDSSVANQIKKPFVMYIGGTDSRKRIQDVVFAFNIVRGRGVDLELVLVGNEFKKLKDLPNVEARNAILESGYKDSIKLVGFITDAQKRALYKKAHALIFCTTYEGFGLPVVEAMAMGCAVISYDNSSIPEAAGSAALLVPTGNYVAVAQSLLELQDEKLRQKLIEKGYAQAEKFDWQTSAKSFLDAVKKR